MPRRKTTNPIAEQNTDEVPAWQKLAQQIDSVYPTAEQPQEPEADAPAIEATSTTAAIAAPDAHIQVEASEEDNSVNTSPLIDKGDVDVTFVAVLPDDEVEVSPTTEYIVAEDDSTGDDSDVQPVDDTWIPLADAAALVGVKYQQVYQRAIYMKKLDTRTGNDNKLLVRRSQVLEWQAKRSKVGEQDE